MSDAGLFELLATDRRAARYRQGVAVAGADECWEWARSRSSSGYGVLRIGAGGVSHTIMAHRAAWMLAHGLDIPDGQVVDHLCGNRACCNPKHLEAVSQTENVRRSAKYRAGPGEVVSVGPATIRARGSKFMVIWRERLDSGAVRQRGRTFANRSEAEDWASENVDSQHPYASGRGLSHSETI